MKKFFAAAVALALACALSTAAFAETMETGTKQIDVIAKHNDGTTTATVYSVDVTWDDMTFIYNESGSKTWNPDTHTHTDNTTAGWNKTSAAIKVTNHSNAGVNVNFAYASAGDTGVDATLDKADATLKAGEEGNYAGAESTTATLSISGTANGIRMGTITVTVAGV